MSKYVELKDIYDTDIMDGHEFEFWCASLLQHNGFNKVAVTRGSGDQGVDIVAWKDGYKYAIQCKRYHKNLNNKPIQEVYAGKAHYSCQVAAVMTNNYFTTGAKELAKSTGVELWDRNQLIFWLENANNQTHIRSFLNRKVNTLNNRPKHKSHTVFSYIARHPIITFFVICFSIIIPFSIPSESDTNRNAEPTPSQEVKVSVEPDASSFSVNYSYNEISAQLHRVEANTFDYVGYDANNQVLVVHIPRYEAYYCYYDFPPQKYISFSSAERPDVYFNNSIGGQYKTIIVPDGDASISSEGRIESTEIGIKQSKLR